MVCGLYPKKAVKKQSCHIKNFFKIKLAVSSFEESSCGKLKVMFVC